MKTVGHEKYKNQWMSDNDIDCLLSAKLYINTYGYPPLYNEIANSLNLTKDQVTNSMSNLEELGMIMFKRQRARGYIITMAGEMFRPAGKILYKKHMTWGHWELTDIELETMRAINSLFTVYQVPPSFTEVGNRVGMSSTAHVAQVIARLREKGYLYHPVASENQFDKVLTRTEKGVQVGLECPAYL